MQVPEVLGGRYELRGFWAAAAWPEFATIGTLGWTEQSPSNCCIPRRFEIEARAAVAINHPHIVAVHDSGDHDEIPTSS